MPRDGADEVAALWAMVAELERQFAGYKQRLAERNGGRSAQHDDDDAAAACDDDAGGGVGYGGGDAEAGGGVRGRMYEAYVRRRDERLRQGWRARMERKEAEVMAFWAQLELTGRAGGNASGERAPAGGGGPTTTTPAGDEERKTERHDDDKKRSSEAALAPRRVSGKKHARTRSFSSSSTNTGRTSPDVGRRRALSQEPPPSEPQVAGDASKEQHPARPTGGAAKTTTATSRPKTALRRKNSVRGHGGAKQAGPKLPRSLPRRSNSGGLEDLGREAGLPNAEAAGTYLESRSSEHALHGQAAHDSPPRQFDGDGTGAADAQAASPGSDRSEVVDAVPDGETKTSDAQVKKRGDEEANTSHDEKRDNPNGEITSDSDIEPSYVYINKDDVVEKQATSVPGSFPPHDAEPECCAKTSEQNSETTTPPQQVDATAAAEITTTNAAEAPARESSDSSSFSVRIERSAPNSAAPSCSSRERSIERLLEADAARLRKKREARAEKSAGAVRTPGSAGSRVSNSNTARSPKETPKGFKRFLSFGKKNRTREVTVIDCTSPSVSSVADDDSGGWQSAGSIKPRMGSSDAASDDTDHGRTNSPQACSLQSLAAASPAKSEFAEIAPHQVKSPKAHRSFFLFRSLNCGRS